MAQADPAGDDAHAVIVRPSCEGDVEAMLAIYRHHIRRGVEDGVDDNGMLQPDDLRDRRKNLRDRRFPHLVATLHNGFDLHMKKLSPKDAGQRHG